MYDELMAEIARGRVAYFWPPGPEQYYVVTTDLEVMRVRGDGRCFINGVYAPDAPDFLRAIIDTEHKKALDHNELRRAIDEGRAEHAEQLGGGYMWIDRHVMRWDEDAVEYYYKCRK